MNTQKLDQRSKYLRRRIIETLDATRRGHVGAALSLVEIIRVLYDDVLHYDVRNPKWSERDRCILSKGHGCLALYVVLQDKGFFPELVAEAAASLSSNILCSYLFRLAQSFNLFYQKHTIVLIQINMTKVLMDIGFNLMELL